jgi:translation initiation factor IF-2
MPETKFRKVRLFKVSRELNIAVEGLVEHLEATGHSAALAGSGINAAITDEDAYLELVAEFAEDKEIAARIRKKRAAREDAIEEAEAVAVAEPATEPEEALPAAEEPATEEGLPATEEALPEAEAESAAEAPVDEAAATPDVGEAETATESAPAVDTEEVEIPEAELGADQATDEVEAEPVVEAELALEVAEVEEALPEVVAPEPVTPVVEATEEHAAAEAAPRPEKEGAPGPEESVETVAEAEPEAVEPTEDEAPVGEEVAEAEASELDPETPEGSVPDAEPGPEAVEDAPPTEAGEPDAESLLAADRYKLSGTKVLGKIDLAAVQKQDDGRKKKRKRIAKSGDQGPSVPDRASRKKKAKPTKSKGASVDQADVEKTLQDTLRELEQGASRARQRRRRARRDERAADRDREVARRREEEGVLRVTEFVSTGELANLMDVEVNEVISTLFGAGMMVSINQRLDADTITIVADEFGYAVEFITDFEDAEVEIEEDDPADLKPRAAVVTVMGHVDHGKTSLLDHIRKANVVAGEAGGITQHIGAYNVGLPDGRNMTFLDTPGHEAFTAMRARGAQVTDVVVLVVAADDAVMPQTIEAINHARSADVPVVVAINKIDKPDTNIPRVQQQLADQNVLVEQYGGKVQCAMVSAHTGEGVDDLLEKILLEAELLDLTANPDRNAVAAVIESRLEKGRGTVATVLVQNGTLKVGDIFVAGAYSGRVRAMFDERDNRVSEVGPSHPVLVSGLPGAPEVGDTFLVIDDERDAREIAQKRHQIQREQSMRQRKHITLDEIGRRLALGDFRELNLIVKGDVGGSVEAVADSLLKLSTGEVAVNIVHKGVGAINDGDVMLASASDAIIIGFQVRPAPTARALAEQEEIDIRLYSVIYNAIAEVRDALEGLLSPERSEKILGTAEVRETFKVPKIGMVAGCAVVEGKIRRSDRVHLIRDSVVIYEGSLASLRRFKDDVREVQNGYECGMGIENFNDIKVGDQIEAYEIIETKRKLEA